MNQASPTTTHSSTVRLTEQLINLPTITPDNSNCQSLIAQHLEQLGFTITPLPSGEVNNLWAIRGQAEPCIVFAGHTDVVPPGDLAQWNTPPFEASIKDGTLYGRGAADMKGAIAAMLTACSRFIAAYPEHKGSIGFMITGDEEGIATDGTIKIVEHLIQQQHTVDYCIIGEPSSEHQLGDTIKIGRRGSLSGQLTVQGKQGHIAYPHLADNPIHKSFKALDALASKLWDTGNQYFDPTSFQYSSVVSNSGATNVTPETLTAQFNLRYSPENTANTLKAAIISTLTQHELNYTINWHHSGKPFYSEPKQLIPAVVDCIETITTRSPQLSTSGGTSDGRFITDLNCELVELGVINKTIHQTNEAVNINDLNTLSSIYEAILIKLLT